uniref:RNA helicase n=1 Tax=Compsopogon caeruleus TaxID=31354 RepID=A0A7S1XDG1_9RHOD|mmetsp:Transcript_17553/g.36432  ORF Transcript_17553/g.36432 Transcript_17553/m.36432 type:complete len:670 (+) Transcript_17553:1456-3465(+)
MKTDFMLRRRVWGRPVRWVLQRWGISTRPTEKSWSYHPTGAGPGVAHWRELSAAAGTALNPMIQSSVPTDVPSDRPVASLSISPAVKNQLEAKGIEKLFPIQEMCLEPILQGRDVIARARTGTGKTIAFALPLVEKIMAEGSQSHLPSVLVVEPTRELAKQVEGEFIALGPSVRTVCVYGGASYLPQEAALRRGIDVVVGTPGRLVDHLDRGNLNLSAIRTCVLDEADEMLKKGFAEEMNRILTVLPPGRQTLLFSATVPEWVKETSRRSMDKPLTIDLVEDEKLKIPSTVRHIALLVQPSARERILGDVLTVHGGDRSIVFVPTKKEADILASSPLIRDDTCVLHGDINQAGREIALAGFRSGRYRNLVATDVAARGIDIPNVDLVVQYSVPDRGDVDTYIHRSGRTGRAGRSGTSIVFYTVRDTDSLRRVEHAIGTRLEQWNPPNLEDVLRASSSKVRSSLQMTPEPLVNQFLPEAERYLEAQTGSSDHGMPVLKAVSAALARLAGFNEPVMQRSILSHRDNFIALELSRRGSSGNRGESRYLSPRTVTSMVCRSVAHLDKVPALGRIVSYNDGAVVDVEAATAKILLEEGISDSRWEVKEITSLPAAAVDEMMNAEMETERTRGMGRVGGNRGRMREFGGRVPHSPTSGWRGRREPDWTRGRRADR